MTLKTSLQSRYLNSQNNITIIIIGYTPLSFIMTTNHFVLFLTFTNYDELPLLRISTY